MEMMHMTVIHRLLSTPMIGRMNIGKISATIMPLIIIVDIWLNTDSLPRWLLSRVDSGTIKL
ncbi:hypothetical protein D3C72_2537230 [compost metagenome]